MLSVVNDNEIDADLGGFLEFLFRKKEGFVYVATKSGTEEFHRKFFRWPTEAKTIRQFIQLNSNVCDVYIGPSLYKEAGSATYENVAGTYAYWSEFDGKVPTAEELSSKGVPSPSLRMRSSVEGHEHWYWALSEFDDNVNHINEVNSALTYLLAADTSGWDATQILRPPGTKNYKYENTTTEIIKIDTTRQFDSRVFEVLPPSPVGVYDKFTVDDLVNTLHILGAYSWTPYEIDRLRVTADPGTRSDRMMEVAYICAEKNLSDVEIFSMLYAADQRIQKFKLRDDRIHRLNDIVYKARIKYPRIVVKDTKSIGIQELLDMDLRIEWQIENLLERSGLLEIVGPPGVGKTTLTLRLGINAAIGTPNYIGLPLSKPTKVLMFSQEMGLTQLRHFLSTMNLDSSHLGLINDNFKINENAGEILNLMSAEGRKIFEDAVIRDAPEIVIIDSLGYIGMKLQSDDEVQDFMNWLQGLRQKYNFSVIVIHHNRKANGQNKIPNKLDDVYGSRYITAFATSVAFLWPYKDCLRMSFPKIRLAQERAPIFIERSSNIDFTLMGGEIPAAVYDNAGPVEVSDDDNDFGGLNFD